MGGLSEAGVITRLPLGVEQGSWTGDSAPGALGKVRPGCERNQGAAEIFRTKGEGHALCSSLMGRSPMKPQPKQPSKPEL